MDIDQEIIVHILDRKEYIKRIYKGVKEDN